MISTTRIIKEFGETACIAGDRAIGDADCQRNERGEQANRERNPSSDEDTCEKIAAIGIGPEQKHGPLHGHVDVKAAPFVCRTGNIGGSKEIRSLKAT